jgi:hypothetical protein
MDRKFDLVVPWRDDSLVQLRVVCLSNANFNETAELRQMQIASGSHRIKTPTHLERIKTFSELVWILRWKAQKVEAKLRKLIKLCWCKTAGDGADWMEVVEAWNDWMNSWMWLNRCGTSKLDLQPYKVPQFSLHCCSNSPNWWTFQLRCRDSYSDSYRKKKLNVYFRRKLTWNLFIIYLPWY